MGKNFNLKVSYYELLILEVEIENRCKDFSEMGLSVEKEKALLKKIYKISPSEESSRLKNL